MITEGGRGLREAKGLSQSDIEERSGLLRNFISRVENGHTVPALETLEKIARGLEVSLYQLFYDGKELPREGPARQTPTKETGWSFFGRFPFLHFRAWDILLQYANA